jgi:hypothetical protein
VFTQTVQTREMSWHGNDSGDDGGYGYESDDGYDAFDDVYNFHDDDDSDEESIESDTLLRRNIISGLHASSVDYLDLSDELWTSSVTMESFQHDMENIIVALQSNRSLEMINISSDVFAAIGERKQGRLFYSLGNLPTLQGMTLSGGTGSRTAMHTRVLADALSKTSNGLKSLELSGLKISSRSEVEQLARGVKARVESLDTLVLVVLVHIVLDVEDKTGFLDPILLALASVPGEPRGQLSRFRLNCVEESSNRASLISPEALGTFFAEEPPVEMPRLIFRLQNLGLNDNHCEVIAQELLRDDALLRPINVLGLSFNPSIGKQGYEALLGLLNRRFDIGVVQVDDKNWKATFDLVIHMNFEFDRGSFLENGVFPTKAMWVNFLAELTNARYVAAMRLAAIWYTLRENPDWIYSL